MSSEALLGQNVALIYDFIKQAVAYRGKGEHWEALKMLDIAASLSYLDEGQDKPLNDLADKIAELTETAKTLTSPSPEAELDARMEYLNKNSADCFSYHLKALRNYMQGAGYYVMMNPGWKMSYPAGGRKSGDALRKMQNGNS